MPTDGSGLAPYDPADPPGDVSTTTTDQGKVVPFIVRQETGVIARDEYRIAVLYDPNQPWEPWAPQAGYNGKLVIMHGASCDTSYAMGSAPDVLDTAVLGKGFAVMSHALDNSGHNCNVATQAESLIMTKEHLVETYGPIRYTIGSGCSGGALAQQQVANAYPGVYQGITPACSYPDAWTSAMQYVDYDRLLAYFSDPTQWSPGTVWEETQIAQVLGHPNPANPVTFTTVIPNSGKPTRDCPGVPADEVYDAETNPDGVRCSLQDYMKNIFGTDPDTGFALRPAGNVGIMYGLEGLMKGTLLPQQFVDVNTKIGGVDIDYAKTEARVAADDLAVQRARTAVAQRTPPSTSTRSPSSTCAVPTPAPSTTCTAPTRCGSASSVSTAPPTTRCCGGAACRSSATRRSPTTGSSPWIAGSVWSRTTTATFRSRRRSSRHGRPPASPTGAPPAPDRTCPCSTARRSSSATPRHASPPACPPPTMCSPAS